MVASSMADGGEADIFHGQVAEYTDTAISTTGLNADVGQNNQAAPPRIDPSPTPRNATGGAVNADGDAVEESCSILPQGFVENTSAIYKEVAGFDVIPPDKLREYWRVYTTTHRTLYDPTANRLENFWWHVWGSKSRNLSGRTVARLYKNISTGPTFVPLRMPTNRYDGPMIPGSLCAATRVIPKTSLVSKSTKAESPQADRPAITNGTGASSSLGPGKVTVHNGENSSVVDNDAWMERGAPAKKEAEKEAQIKMLSSSSSRPPPAQSILRKPRPSLSGPRLTPRFALPSGTQSDKEGGEKAHDEIQEHDDEEAEELASAIHYAAADSATRETIDTNASNNHKSKTPKPSSSSVGSNKGGAVRRDIRKLSKAKPAKKKFVVNSSASKKRNPMAKRSGSHGSQSSAGSEGPISRNLVSHLPAQDAEDFLLEEEDEAEGDNISTSHLPHFDEMPPKSPLQQQQQKEDFAQLYSSQQPAMSGASVGKNPVQPRFTSQQEHMPSPASGSALVSSVFESTATSVPYDTGATPSGISRSYARGSQASFTQQTPLEPVLGGLAALGGTSMLNMPMLSRNNAAEQRREHTAESICRPGGGLIRQSTMPYDIGQSHRQQIGRGSLNTAAISMRSFGSALPPTSSYMGSGATALPAMSTSIATAPQMGRSISQDSYYGSRPRSVREGYQSPRLGPMRSSTVTAPSMVDASGEFMDAEGPDTFEIYARTGLDDAAEERAEREQSQFGAESGSFSSSFQEQQPMQRALYTPTRPTQTPRIRFARTRSQLNVILDREKERLGEGNFASWQESRGSRDTDLQRDRDRGSRS